MPATPIPAASYIAPAVVIQPSETGSIDRIMLPIFEEANSCRGNPENCVVGLKVTAASQAVLVRLAQVLAGCAKGDGVKVTVNVRGFASSSEFSGVPDGNRQLAELRAKKVAQIMNKDVDSGRFEALPLPWPTPGEMERARHYVDSNRPRRYWPARGVLNLRAEIIFPTAQLGTCDVETALMLAFPERKEGEE